MSGEATTFVRAPWRVGDVWLNGSVAEIMGVVNVTPDSCHDGGSSFSFEAAAARAEQLAAAGARIIDIGGESSRPGAAPVSLDEELSRVIPLVEWAAATLSPRGILLSIDTVKAEVARAAAAAGARIVNDISNLTADSQMASTVAELSRQYGVAVVLNHIQGTPRTMQREPYYGDVVAEVTGELLQSAETLEALGMERERICIDPGIGFGKNLAHNLALITDLQQLCRTGYPVLVGLSYKSLFGAIDRLQTSDRKIPSIAGAIIAELSGARVVRVHDVDETAEAFALIQALRESGSGSPQAPFCQTNRGGL